MDKTIENVRYFGRQTIDGKPNTTTLELVGLDTEAYTTGECFMIATSEGDVWHAADWPRCVFTRKYRRKKFACWNLKYDEGALLQFLPEDCLHELWEKGKTDYDGWKVRSIPQKMLSISRSGNAVTLYDMYQFYGMSLDAAAKKYLGESKIDIDTKRFTPEIVDARWDEIANYCVRDAELAARLSQKMVGVFLKFDIYPSKLYSTAYVSFQYFKSHTKYPTVKNLWDDNKSVLGYAMNAYRGGKFEVTRKGGGFYYEYDIVSAYPNEIKELVDISHARIIYSKQYRKNAVYGFLHVKAQIPNDIYSPLAIKRGALSVYPVGLVDTWCTKEEYEYLLRQNIDVEILEAAWLHIDRRTKPFKDEIERLVLLKQQYKGENTQLEYHTVKILLNSLYGKMVQLINARPFWRASSCWNPIYAAVITANVRIRISEMQQLYDSVVAVHTDSVISTAPLPLELSKSLGGWMLEDQGDGVIIGSGVYQIADKVRFRGFGRDMNLMELCTRHRKTVDIPTVRAVTWRECAFHKWEKIRINRFEDTPKKLRCDFDCKRLWLGDYKRFDEILKRNVQSLPIDADILRLLG